MSHRYLVSRKESKLWNQKFCANTFSLKQSHSCDKQPLKWELTFHRGLLTISFLRSLWKYQIWVSDIQQHQSIEDLWLMNLSWQQLGKTLTVFPRNIRFPRDKILLKKTLLWHCGCGSLPKTCGRVWDLFSCLKAMNNPSCSSISPSQMTLFALFGSEGTNSVLCKIWTYLMKLKTYFLSFFTSKDLSFYSQSIYNTTYCLKAGGGSPSVLGMWKYVKNIKETAEEGKVSLMKVD